MNRYLPAELLTYVLRVLPLAWCLTALLPQTGTAQQNLNDRAEVVSPEVHEDGTVTFKLYAPHADTVRVRGDWAVNDGVGQMTKDGSGVWTYTTERLPSDLYLYTFSLDSVRMTDPSNAFSYRDVGRSFSLFLTPGENGHYYGVQDVPHGNVVRTWYPSPTFGTDRRMTVYTPPGYGAGEERYPVLYLLHGSGGDEEAWVTLGRVPYLMDNLIAEGKIAPMLVVMPNGNPAKAAAPGETAENFSYRPVMSQYLPNFRQGDYELAFDEIVDFVDTTYRTRADKASRAVAGLSMGGFHSAIISANHPDLFDYVGLFSPGVPSDELDTSWPAYADLDEKLRVQMDERLKLYWIAIGNTDFLYDRVARFRKRMDELQFPYTYVETERGHIWSNWRKYMLQFAPQLFRKE